MQGFIESGSYLALFLALLGGGVGAPIPEDLVLLTAGALSHQGVTRWWLAGAVCFVGVIGGDTLLYFVARKLGNAALEHRRFRKLLPPERRRKLEHLFDTKGPWVIAVARFIPGVRAPTFALAGIDRYPFKKFLFWDALALCVSGPLTFGLGYLFAGQLEEISGKLDAVKNVLLILLVVAFAIWASVRFWRSEAGKPIRTLFSRRAEQPPR